MKTGKCTILSEKKKKSQLWEEAKAMYDRDEKFANQILKRKSRSLVGSSVPGATKSDEIVANGPQERHKTTALQRRIFLWRNVSLGSDFTNRGLCVSSSMTFATSQDQSFNKTKIVGRCNPQYGTLSGTCALSSKYRKVDMIAKILSSKGVQNL